MVEPSENKRGTSRRKFLSLAVMAGAMMAAYGFFAGIIMKFLYPQSSRNRLTRMFVTFADRIGAGASHAFYTPKGEQVILTNTGQLQAGKGHSFIAFSSRCPHLGCKVHYNGSEQKFICPCHQGVFNQDGLAISGPPAQANQKLSQFEVLADGNSIYVMVEVS